MTLDDIAPSRSYLGGQMSFICGMNGSGKTVLGENLMQRHKYAAVHDGKGSLRWKGWRPYDRLADVLREDARGKLPNYIIYSPNRREIKDLAAQNAFFEWQYERALRTNGSVPDGSPASAYCHFGLGVDELTAGVVNRFEPLPAYNDCVTRSRSNRLYVYSVTQRPRMIPGILISESRFVYVFYLNLFNDRQKIYENVPLDKKADAIAQLRDHEFYAYAGRSLYGPLKLSIGGSAIERRSA